MNFLINYFLNSSIWNVQLSVKNIYLGLLITILNKRQFKKLNFSVSARIPDGEPVPDFNNKNLPRIHIVPCWAGKG